VKAPHSILTPIKNRSSAPKTQWAGSTETPPFGDAPLERRSWKSWCRGRRLSRAQGNVGMRSSRRRSRRRGCMRWPRRVHLFCRRSTPCQENERRTSGHVPTYNKHGQPYCNGKVRHFLDLSCKENPQRAIEWSVQFRKTLFVPRSERYCAMTLPR
jgi:hypothetical protein